MLKTTSDFVWVMIAAGFLIVICGIKYPQDHVRKPHDLGLKVDRVIGLTNVVRSFENEAKRSFDCVTYKKDPNWFIQWEMTNYANSLPDAVEMKIFDVTGLNCD